uniref:PGAP2 factor n=1 Tax=Syphacia muris TaxID=451379 RepID=A0A0N5ALX0_9BILA
MLVSRVLQFSFSSFLLYKAVMQFLTDPDWWIYVPFYACGAILCIFPLPKSSIWRTFSALVVVLGGLQVLFTSWSLWRISGITDFEPFSESRHVALTAAAVSLTCGTRLSTIQCKSCVSYLRALVLLTILISSLTAFGYTELYSANIPANRLISDKWMDITKFIF